MLVEVPMGYLSITWLALLAAVAALLFGSSREIYVCEGELRELPEPAEWRSWPKVPGDGRFMELAPGPDAAPKLSVGANGLCSDDRLYVELWPKLPFRGPALTAFFRKGFWPTSFRKAPRGDVWVASMKIHRIDGKANEVFLTAFGDVNARHIFFDVRGAALLGALAVAISMLAGALAIGHFRLRTARKLAARHPFQETAYRSASHPVVDVAAVETRVDRFALRTLAAAGVLVIAGSLVTGVIVACS